MREVRALNESDYRPWLAKTPAPSADATAASEAELATATAAAAAAAASLYSEVERYSSGLASRGRYAVASITEPESRTSLYYFIPDTPYYI